MGFDGQEQHLTPEGTVAMGAFAPLADLGSAGAEDCAAASLPDGWEAEGLTGAMCRRTGTGELPWIGGLGWAPDGTVWQVTGLALSVPSGAWTDGADGRPRFVRVQDARQVAPRITVDGQEPVAAFPSADLRTPLTLAAAGEWTVVSGPVAPGTRRTVTVTLPLQGRTTAEGDPEEVDLDLEHTTATH